MQNPLNQFQINKLYELKLLGADFSFTNSSLFLMLALIVSFSILVLGLRKPKLIPDRLQSLSESLYELVEGMVTSSSGEEGKKYLPIIFTLFIFILACNLLGMLPFGFTVTSHIAVTFTLAAGIFIFITVLGFMRHGLSYLELFLPPGTPVALAPLLVVIELFAYLARPITLSLRLAANMAAGHIVLKLIASFVVMAGFFGIFPLALLTILQGFEIFVAILQAYIFTILTCAYLSDAINLH